MTVHTNVMSVSHQEIKIKSIKKIRDLLMFFGVKTINVKIKSGIFSVSFCLYCDWFNNFAMCL